MRRKQLPGSEWRVQKRGGNRFDELVVDRWLHIGATSVGRA